MSVFGWQPRDKQTDLLDDERSPWHNQYTQSWHPMMTWAVPGYLPQHQLPAGTPDVPSPSPRTPANRRPEKHRLPTQCLRGYRGVALLVVFLAVAMISAIGTAIYLAGEETSNAPNTDVTPTTASEAPSTSSMTETSTVTIPKPEETTTTETPYVTTSPAPSVTASESPSVTTSTPSEPTGTTSVTRPTDVTPTTASEAPSTSSVTETSTVTTPKPDKTTSTAPYVTASEAPSVTTSTASKPTGTTSVMKPPEVTPTTASEAPTTSSVTETSTVTTPKPEETTTTVPENCTETTCQNNGTCDDTDGSPVCTCPNDYTGVRCESETEKCKDHTCENGGSCTNTDTGVDCTCPGNYTGDRCEKEKIPCSEVICQNGANCTDTDSGYRCDCPVNLTGLLCETVLTFCERETPCHNGGTCVDLSQNKYLCVCPKCECSAEKPLDNCTIDEANICKIENIKKDKVAHPYNCSKYIDCSGAGNTFLTEGDVWHHEKGNVYDPQTGASATSGTVGCATQTNPALCATSPCANGGICEDTMSGFKCHCPFGRYNGPACENKLITCENVTCLHGTCEDTENGFYCNCSENYVGINCDDEKVLCSAAKCQNGATCTDTDSGYRCECPVMFTGVLCETEYKFCEREMPCRNGGTCVDLPEDKHVCVCPNCGCSTEEPYENCTIDGANICKTENMKHHLVAHPYNCSKYIDCSGPDNTFVKDDYVNNYQSGNVYNPDNGWADTPGNVDCAKQNDPTPCAADTCANGGTCEDSMSGFKCYCPFGQYNGPTCENALTTCENVTCGHGVCEATTNGFYCNCSENYVGIYCQTRKVLCSEVNCTNGASCSDTVAGYICECVAGFTGSLCETDIDDCDPNPCNNVYSKSCVDKVDDYECTCESCNCSTVNSTKTCTLNAGAECLAAKSAHQGRSEFYLAHPYKCDKYLQCYNSGDRGADQPCPGGTHFNMNYDPNTQQPCSSNAQGCRQI